MRTSSLPLDCGNGKRPAEVLSKPTAPGLHLPGNGAEALERQAERVRDVLVKRLPHEPLAAKRVGAVDACGEIRVLKLGLILLQQPNELLQRERRRRGLGP